MSVVRFVLASSRMVPFLIIRTVILVSLAGHAQGSVLNLRPHPPLGLLVARVAKNASVGASGAAGDFGALHRGRSNSAAKQKGFLPQSATNAFASSGGLAGIDSRQTAAGAIDRAAEINLSERALHINNFGTGVGTGNAVTDTNAFKAMIVEAQVSGRPMLIGGVNQVTTLKLREGEIQWTMVNAGSDRPGPVLITQGSVVIEAAGVANAAIFRINNDPKSGGRYISGGFWGPMTFKDVGGATAPLRHAFQLHGVEYMTFGLMTSVSGWKGDIFNIQAVGTLTSADRWHCAFNHFEGIKAYDVAGWGFNNDSVSQVFVFNTINNIYKIRGKGAYRGPGALNKIKSISAAWGTGWAIDLQPSDASGAVQGFIIDSVEIDGSEYGIRCNGVQATRLGIIRAVHRYMEPSYSVMDPSAAYPKVVIQIGGPQGLSTRQVTIKLLNLYKEGISMTNPLLPPGHNIHDKLGTLVDFQDDATINGFDVDASLSYNYREIALPMSRYFKGLNDNVQNGKMRVDGKVVINRQNRSAVIARGTNDIGSISTDFTSRLPFRNEQIDQSDAYNPSTYTYTAQADGLHRFRIQVFLDVDVNDLVRLGVRIEGRLVRQMSTYAAVAGPQSFSLDVTHPLARGDAVTFSGATSVARLYHAGSMDISSNNYIEVTQF